MSEFSKVFTAYREQVRLACLLTFCAKHILLLKSSFIYGNNVVQLETKRRSGVREGVASSFFFGTEVSLSEAGGSSCSKVLLLVLADEGKDLKSKRVWPFWGTLFVLGGILTCYSWKPAKGGSCQPTLSIQTSELQPWQALLFTKQVSSVSSVFAKHR